MPILGPTNPPLFSFSHDVCCWCHFHTNSNTQAFASSFIHARMMDTLSLEMQAKGSSRGQ